MHFSTIYRNNILPQIIADDDEILQVIGKIDEENVTLCHPEKSPRNCDNPNGQTVHFDHSHVEDNPERQPHGNIQHILGQIFANTQGTFDKDGKLDDINFVGEANVQGGQTTCGPDERGHVGGKVRAEALVAM